MERRSHCADVSDTSNEGSGWFGGVGDEGGDLRIPSRVLAPDALARGHAGAASSNQVMKPRSRAISFRNQARAETHSR